MIQRKLLCLLLALTLSLSLAAPALASDTQDAALTRGEFVAGLFGVSGDPDAMPRQDAFDDVPAEGALAQAVGWAADKGVVYGYGNGRFGPDDPVTREQMVTMLYRCAQTLGQAPEGDWMFPLGFRDADTVSAWADKAVQWAVMNRIIIGTGYGIEPKATATDEQLSIVLDRWQDFLVPEGGNRGGMILFTSDVHCGVDKGFGYAGLQEIRNALRAQGYDVLLVDDGDNIQGGPLSTMTKGEALTGLMNQMGYDVAIPGNHEFDYGVERFLSLAEQAEFPYISCNFNYKGEMLFEPYAMFELAGKKIAFVGVTTPETLTSSTPAYFQDADGEFVYGFLQDETGEGVYRAVQSAVDAARAQGAEHVIVLGHLGYYAESAPWNYADVITHTTGFDALLDGHSHDTEQVAMKNAVGIDVLRSACGTKLACVGWCRIPAEGAVSAGLYTWADSVPAAEKLGIDNEMSRAVAQSGETLEAAFGAVVAHTSVALTINDPEAVDANGRPVRMIRRAETNLGDLCADAYRDQSGADVAFVNGGGIRDNIAAGDVTLRDIFNVHPYGNSLCMIEVTGQQLLDALEWGARNLPGETGGFLQVSGLSYEIHSDIQSPCVADENGLFVRVDGERRVKNVRVGGKPIDPEKTYTLAGHDYMLLLNGDGYTMFDGAPLLLNCVKLDNQVLLDYIAETLGGVIGAEYADPYGQGRIKVVESSGETSIRVLETSDIHGYLLDTSSGDESQFQYRLAYIAQIVNEARTSGAYDDVLLVDGGDIYQGMPVSNMTRGAAMRAAFDAMDYDAVALGNHEFDWGVDTYCADPDGTLPAYELGDYCGDPDIPILASNLYYAGTKDRVDFTQDYVIVEKAGARIALIGFVDDYTMTIMADQIAPYDIDGDLSALAARVKEINETEKPDATVVLCHCMPVKVAEALSPEDVDLVAGGHVHAGIYGVADNGVPYIQANASAQGYASATIVIGPDGTVRVEEPMYTAITTDKTALYDIPANADKLDDAVLAISHAAWAEVGDEMRQPLGYIDTPILKKTYVGDGRTTSGGNWITTLMLRSAASDGAVAAFFNMKGVRADLTIPEGETRRTVTVGDVYSLAPFNNTWLIFELSGAEIAQQLRNGFLNTDYGDQVSGLTYSYRNRGTAEAPDIEIVSITLDDGIEVDIHDTKTLYRIVTSNYNATLEGCVFLGKTPVVPEAEAPVDNLTILELVRAEAAANDGHISVDVAPRGTCLSDAELSDAA